MNVKMLVRLFTVSSALLLWQGSQSTLAGNPPFPRPVQYPRDLAEVKKLGGFWKLSTEQQAYVRYRYVDELKVLMEDANLRMRLAQYTGDLRSCYLCRTVIKRLQESIKRAQNPSVDPTGEQTVIANVSIYLAGYKARKR